MKQLGGNDAWLKLAKVRSIPTFAGPNDPSFIKWKHDCLRTIAQIDGEKSPTQKSFEEIDFEGNLIGISVDEIIYRKNFNEGVTKAQAILASIQEAVADEMHFDLQKNAPSSAKPISSVMSKKVFEVHGHDEMLKTQVEQFLERLDLEPIILHKQANQGQTIIEKFERHSDVAFAVVLLTPDDEGRSGKSLKPHWSDPIIIPKPPLLPRARQNVIFEFGFFLGTLGRSKVCGLYCEGVELPSDYDGVLYTKVDETNSWQQELVKELRAAWFAVDANKLT